MGVGLYLKIQTSGSWSVSRAGAPLQGEVEAWCVERHPEPWVGVWTRVLHGDLQAQLRSKLALWETVDHVCLSMPSCLGLCKMWNVVPSCPWGIWSPWRVQARCSCVCPPTAAGASSPTYILRRLRGTTQSNRVIQMCKLLWLLLKTISAIQWEWLEWSNIAQYS